VRTGRATLVVATFDPIPARGSAMRPDPKCVIDRSRPCGSCIAASPRECPYAYLLDAAELAAVASVGAGTRERAARAGS
jgi:hypothetical protein